MTNDGAGNGGFPVAPSPAWDHDHERQPMTRGAHPQGQSDATPWFSAHPRGIDLARAFWNDHGKPMIEQNYPAYASRIACGLSGPGTECHGFDDIKYGECGVVPGFAIWLTAEDYLVIGEDLQADYDALPQVYRGLHRGALAAETGADRYVGVFEVGDFFERHTGYRQAPESNREWMTLDEARLAAATNGQVFVDGLGALSAARGGFLRMPEDVRIALIGRRLAVMAHSGQDRIAKMLARGDGEGAWLAVAEFVKAAASLVFLINRPTSVGYLPSYEWRFAALRRLAARPAPRLPEVVVLLSDITSLASAACRGQGPGEDAAREGLVRAVEQVCEAVVKELQAQHLSNTDERCLSAQRGQVESHIQDPTLRWT